MGPEPNWAGPDRLNFGKKKNLILRYQNAALLPLNFFSCIFFFFKYSLVSSSRLGLCPTSQNGARLKFRLSSLESRTGWARAFFEPSHRWLEPTSPIVIPSSAVKTSKLNNHFYVMEEFMLKLKRGCN